VAALRIVFTARLAGACIVVSLAGIAPADEVQPRRPWIGSIVARLAPSLSGAIP